MRTEWSNRALSLLLAKAYPPTLAAEGVPAVVNPLPDFNEIAAEAEVNAAAEDVEVDEDLIERLASNSPSERRRKRRRT